MAGLQGHNLDFQHSNLDFRQGRIDFQQVGTTKSTLPRTKVKAMPREAISEKKFKHIDNPAKHVSIITLLESVAWHVIANNKDNSRLVSENAELFQPSFLNVSHFYTQV